MQAVLVWSVMWVKTIPQLLLIVTAATSLIIIQQQILIMLHLPFLRFALPAILLIPDGARLFIIITVSLLLSDIRLRSVLIVTSEEIIQLLPLIVIPVINLILLVLQIQIILQLVFHRSARHATLQILAGSQQVSYIPAVFHLHWVIQHRNALTAISEKIIQLPRLIAGPATRLITRLQ
jgi:hypothetical protein